MCKAKIYKLVGFPKPIKVAGRSSAWIESEVDAWIAKVITEARGDRTA
jgi:predicted DNA-binding transcriptional regulator AlpA